MTWRLEAREHRVFERNPLVAVVVQVRFHPILKLEARVPEFQDQIRSRFPVFEKRHVQQVTFQVTPGPANKVDVRHEDQFLFARADGSASLMLGPGSLTLENRSHLHHKELLDDFVPALKALEQVFRPVAPLRLGLRYINVIDRQRVSRELDREVGWGGLVAGQFRTPVGTLADEAGTTFLVETSSPVDPGAMTVRYGMLREPDGEVRFRLDVDRYLDTGVTLDDVPAFIAAFALDIYSVFIGAIGEDMVEWMSGTGECHAGA
jgi:uncharacterized protein (TIGR04255 family)